MKKFIIITIITCIASISSIHTSHAQWSINPSVDDSLHAADYQNFAFCSDGSGGVFYSWQTSITGSYTIHLNRKDGTGNFPWGINGIAVNTSSSSLSQPRVAEDGSGGCYVAYEVGNADYINCHRFDANGNSMWANPTPVFGTSTSSLTFQNSPFVVNNYNNGVFVAAEAAGSSGGFIRGQLINLNGNIQWGTEGIPVVNDASSYGVRSPMAVQDGVNGFVVEYLQVNFGSQNVRIQRITGTGTQQWGSTGILLDVVNHTFGYASNYQLIKDNENNFISCWNPINGKIYAQKLNPSGAFQWGSNELPVCDTTGAHGGPNLCSDNAGGAFFTWVDGRKVNIKSELYAQRITAAGTRAWQSQGIAIDTSAVPSSFACPNLVPDGNSGARIFWRSTTAAHTQNISSSGALTFPLGGYTISGTNIAYLKYSKCVTQTTTGDIVVFFNNVNGGEFAKKVPVSCSTAAPAITSVTATCAPNSVAVKWDGNLFDTYEVRYKISTDPNWTSLGNLGHINSRTFSNLEASTKYKFSVRGVCDPGGAKSAWGTKSKMTKNCLRDGDEENISTAAGFTAYPNPAHESVNILLCNHDEASEQLLLTDVAGKLLHQQEVTPFQNSVQLDVHELHSGLYFIILTRDKERWIQKLVIE